MHGAESCTEILPPALQEGAARTCPQIDIFPVLLMAVRHALRW